MVKNEDIFIKFAEKSGTPIAEIKSRYDELYKEHGSKAKTLRKLKGEIQRENGSLRSSAVMWKGFIMGDTGIIDFIDLMRKKAEGMYNNPTTRNLAVNILKIITKDGTPLDTRKIVNFVDNENYMQELKGHSYSRTMYGCAGIGKEMKDPKFFQLNWGDKVAERDVPFEFYKMYTFRGTVGKTDREMYKINAKGVTNFKEVEDISLEEKIKMLEECGYKIWKVSEISKAFTLNMDEKKEDRTDQSYGILIKGVAAEIDYTVNDQGNRRINMNDEDMWNGSYTCWVPAHIPLEFGEDSEIIVVGNITKRTFNNKEQFNINCEGLIPLSGFFKR